MPRILSACLAIVLYSATALAADVPAAPPSTQPATAVAIPTADEILKQLGDGDWHARRRAMDQIVSLGSDVIPVLNELQQRNLEGEVRKNVELIVQRIQENREMGPTLLTLHVKNAAPAQVFAEIERQCAAPIPTWPEKLWQQPGWQTLSLDIDRRPFWGVIDELSKKLQVEYLAADPQELKIARDSGRTPGGKMVSGAFLVTADVLTFRNWMNVELSVYGEPKICITKAIGFKLERADDDHGNPLLPQTTRRAFGRRFRTGSRQLPLPFQRPPDEVSQIAHLQGSMRIAIQTASATWKVSDPLSMSPQTRTVDAMPVTMESFGPTRTGDGYELVLSVPSGWSSKGSQDELLDLVRKRLQVLDGDGHRLSLGNVDPRAANDTTELTADFTEFDESGGKTGAPSKIVWDIPVETREMSIPFDFRDLPIVDN